MPGRADAAGHVRVAGAARHSREARFLARAVALASRDGDRDTGIGDLLGLIARASGATDVAVAVHYRGRRIVIARADAADPAGRARRTGDVARCRRAARCAGTVAGPCGVRHGRAWDRRGGIAGRRGGIAGRRGQHAGRRE